jgi:hypothetical protein
MHRSQYEWLVCVWSQSPVKRNGVWNIIIKPCVRCTVVRLLGRVLAPIPSTFRPVSPHQARATCQAGIFYRQKLNTFILFPTLFSAARIEKRPQWLKVRNDFDMAGEKFDMPSGSRTLIARRLLLVNLHPAQTGSAMRSYSQKY